MLEADILGAIILVGCAVVFGYMAFETEIFDWVMR
jgi:hypothetical protein